MLLADDMVDLTTDGGVGFRDQAVFAQIPCAFRHLRADVMRDIAGHSRAAPVRGPSPAS